MYFKPYCGYIPTTNIISTLLVITTSYHVDAPSIILVDEKCAIPFSVKDEEYGRRAAKYSHIPNVLPKGEDIMPTHGQFNEVMSNCQTMSNWRNLS